MARPGIGKITQTPADTSNWVLNCATTGCDEVFRERNRKYDSWINPRTNRKNTTCHVVLRTEAYDTAVDGLWAVHKKALVCPNCAKRLRVGIYQGRK
jgi:hypothetical protein